MRHSTKRFISAFRPIRGSHRFPVRMRGSPRRLLRRRGGRQRRHALLVESLEPRVVLDASSLDAAQAAALLRGIEAFSQQVAAVQAAGPLSEAAVGIGQPLGTLLSIGDELRRGFSDPLSSRLVGQRTVQQIEDAFRAAAADDTVANIVSLSEISHRSVMVDGSETLWFEMTLAGARSLPNYRLDLGQVPSGDAGHPSLLDLGLQLDPVDVDVTAGFSARVGFGVDLTPGLAADQATRVKFEPLRIDARAAETLADLDANLGAIRLGPADVRVDFSVAATIGSSSAAPGIDFADDPGIPLARVIGSPAAGLFTLAADPAAHFDVTIPFTLSVGGFVESGRPLDLGITAADLFRGAGELPGLDLRPLPLTPSGGGAAIDIGRLGQSRVSDFAAYLDALKGIVPGLIGGLELPVVGAKAAAVFDLANQITSIVDSLHAPDGTLRFHSLDEMVERLAVALPETKAADFNPRFNPGAGAIELSLPLQANLVSKARVDPNNLVPAALSPALSVTGSATADLTLDLGVTLVGGTILSADKQSDPLDRVYVAAAPVGTASVSIKIDMQAGAALGPLALSIATGQGLLAGGATVAVSLAEPAAGDGRITLAELVAPGAGVGRFVHHEVTNPTLNGIFQLLPTAGSAAATSTLQQSLGIEVADYRTLGCAKSAPYPPLVATPNLPVGAKVPFIEVGLVDGGGWSAQVAPSEKLVSLFTGVRDLSVAGLPSILALVPGFLERSGVADLPVPLTGGTLGDILGLAGLLAGFRAPDLTLLLGDPTAASAAASSGTGFTTDAFMDDVWGTLKVPSASFGLTGFDITPFFSAMVQRLRDDFPVAFSGFADVFGRFERLVWEFDKLRGDWQGRLPNADGTQGFADFDASFLSKLRGWASAGSLILGDIPSLEVHSDFDWNGVPEYVQFRAGFDAILGGVQSLPGGFEDIGGLFAAGFPGLSVSFTPVAGTSLFDLSFDLAGVRRTLDFAAVNLGGGIPLDVTGGGSVSFVLGGKVTARVGWDPVTHAPTLDAANSNVAITAGIDDGGGVSLVASVGGLAGAALGWTDTGSHPERRPARLTLTNTAGDGPALFQAGGAGIAPESSSAHFVVDLPLYIDGVSNTGSIRGEGALALSPTTFSFDIGHVPDVVDGNPVTLPRILANVAVDFTGWLDGAQGFVDVLLHGLADDLLKKIPFLGGIDIGDIGFFQKLDTLFNPGPADLHPLDLLTPALFGPSLSARIGDLFPGGSVTLRVEGVDENGLPIDRTNAIAAWSDLAASDRVIVELSVQKLDTTTLAGGDVDLGIDSLGLALRGDAALELATDFTINVGLGYSRVEGFFVQAVPGGKDEISASIGLGFKEGASCEIRLGVLYFGVEDNSPGTADPANRELNAGVHLNFPDSRTGLADLPGLVLASSLSGDVKAGLDLKISAGLGFAALSTSLKLGFSEPNGAPIQLTPKIGEINLADKFHFDGVQGVSLTLDILADDSAIGRLIKKADEIIEPLKPIVRTLKEEIPIVSDVSKKVTGTPITYLQAIEQSPSFSQQTKDSLEKLVTLVDTIELLRSLHGTPVSLGRLGLLGGFNPRSLLADGAIDKNAFDPDAVEEHDSLVPDSVKALGLDFPIFTDTFNQLFNLLFGRDADIVTWHIPGLEDLGFHYDEAFNLFGPLYVRLAGDFAFTADIDLGLDTRGIRQAFGGSEISPLKLFNGIYLGDHVEGGIDKPELLLNARILAGIGAGLPGIAEAEVDGGLLGQLSADLKDRTRDGKVHLDELAANLLRGPECVFDFAGNLSAVLIARLRVGIDTPFGFKGYTKTWELYDTTIADFEIITCPPAAPKLADVVTVDADHGFDTGPAGPFTDIAGTTVLVLNVGTRAARVVPGRTSDGDEEFTVEAKDGGILVKGYETEEFISAAALAGVQWIVFDAGIGNDSITVAPEVTLPVWGYGGPGRDRLTAGSADGNRLYGDGGGAEGAAGGDKLIGRGGVDWLFGQGDDDFLYGYGGADHLDGGDGDDQFYGDDDLGDWTVWVAAHPDFQSQSPGADDIHGGAGRDTILGGDAGDQLSGGDDDDEIQGNAGDDTIEGGAGVDELLGDSGNDTIWGEDADRAITAGSDTINADMIEGGFGFNVIHGGPGGDVIYAVSKLDGAEQSPQPLAPYGYASQLYGDDGADTIYGTANADLIEGGFEGDAIYSGVGKDEVVGGPGSDLLVAAGGAARLFGGYGDDVIDGGDGANWIEGGPGDDKLFGRGGEDTIYGGTTNAGYGYLVADEASGRPILDPLHGGFTATVRPDSCAPEVFHHPEVYPEAPFTITVNFFDDLDGNGVRSEGEPDAFSQFGTWSILLVSSTPGSGIPPATFTTRGGVGHLPARGGLPAGAWSLLVTSWPGGDWQPSSDAALATATPLVLDADHPVAAVNLPYYRPGALGGTVSRGSPAVHQPASNVRVFIDRDKDGLLGADEPTVLSDATGGYRFDGRWTALPPGSFEIRVDLPPGTPSVPRLRQATLTSGATVSGLDFVIPESVTTVSAVLLGEGTASEEPRWVPVPDGMHQLDPLAPRVGFTRLAVEVISTSPLAAADFDPGNVTLVRVKPDGSDGDPIGLNAPAVLATASGEGKRLAFTVATPPGTTALPTGRYRLRLPDTTVNNGAGKLDGEWANPAATFPAGTRFASGNGVAGGAFMFDFVVAVTGTGSGTGQGAPPAAAAVEGAVWMQVYGAGSTDGHDAAEPVLVGQTVRVLDEAGNVVAETVTGPIDLDGNGRIEGAERAAYRFAGLPAGHYRIEAATDAGWSPATIDRKLLAPTYFAVGHLPASGTEEAMNSLSSLDVVASKATLLGTFSGLVARDVAAPTHGQVYVAGTATIDFGVIPAGSGGLWSVGTAYPWANAIAPSPGGVPLLALDVLDARTLVGVSGSGELFTYSLLTNRWTALGALLTADHRRMRPVGDIAVVSPDEIYAVAVEAPADPAAKLDLVLPGQQRLVRIDATVLGANTTVVRSLTDDGITELIVGLETDGPRLLALSRMEKLSGIDPAAVAHGPGAIVAGLGDLSFGGLALAPAEVVSDYVPGQPTHASETWIDVIEGGATVVVDFPSWPWGRTLEDGDDTIDGGCGDTVDHLFGDDGDLPTIVQSVGGRDTIRGRGGADEIDGGLRGDTLFGDGGRGGDRGDTITGGRGGGNWIEGGDGDDTITGGPMADMLFGDAGDDTITGSDGDDVLCGDAGGDYLAGGLGSDLLVAGAGGGARVDEAHGDGGDDTLFVVETSLGGRFAALPAAGADGDTYDGGDGVDTLVVGTSSLDAAHDLAAATLTQSKLTAWGIDWAGGLEIALFAGGAGDNAFSAATFSGRVVMRGHGGDDLLTGSPGDDLLDGGNGLNNRLAGGSGDDRYVVVAGGATQITEVHGGGVDRLDLTGIGSLGFDARVSAGFAGTVITSVVPAATVRFANDGIDVVFLGSGHDSVTLESGAMTTASWVAGGGTDWLRYTDAVGDWGAWAGGVSVDLARGSATGTNGAVGFENVIGGKGNDTLSGDDAGNRLDGAGGHDILAGRAGDDTLVGGPGDDDLAGGPDNDTLRGDGGVNSLDGGSGDDSYEFLDLGEVDTIFEVADKGSDRMVFSSGQAGILFEIGGQIRATFGASSITAMSSAGIDLVRGGPNADSFRIADGAAFAGRLDGGGVSGTGLADLDTLDYSLWSGPVSVDYSRLADPTAPIAVTGVGSVVDLRHVIGGAKADSFTAGSHAVWFQGGAGGDSLVGSSDADVLEGEAGNDTIDGRRGSDLIRGGVGNDTLVGGPGNDTYGFADAFGVDAIEEEDGSGSDAIDFSGVTVALTVELGSVTATTASGDRATHAGTAIERVRGGAGDDLFVMTSPAVMFAGTLDGAGGTNELTWRAPTRAIAEAVAAGGTPNVGGAVNFARITADANLHAPVFTSGFTGAVNENMPVATVVYTARATDADPAPDNKITYSIEPGLPDDASLVTIDPSSGEVRFLVPANYEAKAAYHFTVIATDAGLPVKSTPSAITVNILNVAELRTAPRIAAPTGFVLTEDTAAGLRFSGSPFSDADSPAPTPMTVTLSIPDGAIAALPAAGVAVAGTPTARRFTGTIAAINAFFTAEPARITYAPAANASGLRQLSVVIAERSGAQTLSSAVRVPVTITPVNDAPVLKVPAGFSVQEDTTANLAWVGKTLVTDVDSPRLTVRLTVDAGRLVAASTPTVAVVGGGRTQAFSGSPAALSAYFAALGRIRYTPPADDTSAHTLTCEASDGEAAVSGTVPITLIPVNDPPIIAAAVLLSGASRGTPFEIGHATLLARSGAFDVDSAKVFFRVERILSGSLQKWDGIAWRNVSVAGASQRRLEAGQSLRWIPPVGASGIRPAFTVRAWDGSAYSTVTATVSVEFGGPAVS